MSDSDDPALELEMVSQQRGFRSVMRLKRWMADRWASDGSDRKT